MKNCRFAVTLAGTCALVALPLSAETFPDDTEGVDLVRMSVDEVPGEGLFELVDFPALASAGLAGRGAGGGVGSAGAQTSKLGSFSININAGSTLAGNAAALAAFQRAADQWEARLADPIDVNVDADMGDLGGGGIIGQASTVILAGGYTLIRDAMVADGSDEADDGILASLPTAAQYGVFLPSGIDLDGNLLGSKANLKALGFGGLDAQFGPTDSTITLNSQFSFDYDNSDGVDPDKIDFETVAAHELGHALGFISEVDDIDWLLDNGFSADISPGTLDMFRFGNEGGWDPETPAEFTGFPRSLAPNHDEITDTLDTVWGTLTFVGDPGEFRMSTGVTQGDGRQASHWKADELTGDYLGMMDPTLSYGVVYPPVGEPDFRAMDLIGYEIDPVPEPSTLVMLLGVAALSLLALRCRRVG